MQFPYKRIMQEITIYEPASEISCSNPGLWNGHLGTPCRQKNILVPQSDSSPKIQAAILLDVSNSMDGLIEQAKSQLWNMVSIMGRASCEGKPPEIEIALYEYGRTSNDAKAGYVKKISGFTSDLDLLAKELFDLTTHGGSEHCGHVMYTSLTELDWDTSAASYKVIFIAGNESFRQGDIPYTRACEEARKKGVIINTIYCGDRQQGIREFWQLSECGSGSYTYIDQDASQQSIPTPYDSMIYVLNTRLNATYIGYGSDGFANTARMSQADEAAFKGNKFERVKVKSESRLYRNDGWDLVDAMAADSLVIDKVDRMTLPDTLKQQSTEQLKVLVRKKQEERSRLQVEIREINGLRDNYIAEAKRKAAENTVQTLESEIEKMIRLQAAQFNMKID